MPRHDPLLPPVVPPGLAAAWGGDDWRAWIAALPGLACTFLDRWQLRPDGPPAHGVIAMVLPVVRADGTPAALKLQQVDEETRGEPLALRTWDGRGAVRLLDSDPETGTMLLERLDAGRSLETLPDEGAALDTLAGLLAELAGYPAPAGLPQLGDLGAAMLDRLPGALSRLVDAADRRLTADCAAAPREVLDRPGDRLLHWDLHYGNVLAPLPEAQRAGRGQWLAIDPKPLAGDPGFELLSALANRWDDVLATGDVASAVRRRFDLLTEAVGLDRSSARRWTLARVLQRTLWKAESGETEVQPRDRAIALALLAGC